MGSFPPDRQTPHLTHVCAFGGGAKRADPLQHNRSTPQAFPDSSFVPGMQMPISAWST